MKQNANQLKKHFQYKRQYTRQIQHNNEKKRGSKTNPINNQQVRLENSSVTLDTSSLPTRSFISSILNAVITESENLVIDINAQKRFGTFSFRSRSRFFNAWRILIQIRLTWIKSPQFAPNINDPRITQEV